MIELSQEVVEAGSEDTSASQAAAPSEPRQSEEARRIQASKDAEIARIRRESDGVRGELEALRLTNQQMQEALGQYNIMSIPDETQRQNAAFQQSQEQGRRQLVQLQQKAAIAEARLEHKDVDLEESELQDLVKLSRNEADFKSRVSKIADHKRQQVKDRETAKQSLREEVEEEVRQNLQANRVTTSTPTSGPLGDETVYRQRYEEAVKAKDPQRIIQARRELEAAKQRR